MKNLISKNRGLLVGLALSCTVLIMVPLITGAAPSYDPPDPNLPNATFNSVTSGFGTAIPSSGGVFQGVTQAVDASSTTGHGVKGTSTAGGANYGVYGDGRTAGVAGVSTNGQGGYFDGFTQGIDTRGRIGIKATTDDPDGLAGDFSHPTYTSTAKLSGKNAAVETNYFGPGTIGAALTYSGSGIGSGGWTYEGALGVAGTSSNWASGWFQAKQAGVEKTSVKLGTMDEAVNAVGIIKNANLTIEADGDLSNSTANPVKVVDAAGLQIDATSAAKGLIVNNPNGGIEVNADDGGVTINSDNGGGTINTEGGGLTINSTTGGMKLISTGGGGIKLNTSGGISNDWATAPNKAVNITDAEGLNVTNNVVVGGSLGAIKNVVAAESLLANRGVWLGAFDEPLITRHFDEFTSGTKTGWGRWGLFMEPHKLVLGFPAIAGKSFAVSKYWEDGSKYDLLKVDNNGNTTIEGGLTVAYNLTSYGNASISGHLKAGSIGSGSGAYVWAGSTAAAGDTTAVSSTCVDADAIIIACNTGTVYYNVGTNQCDVGGYLYGADRALAVTKSFLDYDNKTCYAAFRNISGLSGCGQVWPTCIRTNV